VQLEGLGKLKNPMTSAGIETATFKLVTLCLNQMHYFVPPCTNVVTPVFCNVFKKFTNVVFELLTTFSTDANFIKILILDLRHRYIHSNHELSFTYPYAEELDLLEE
jgi:hypothetical protein